MKIKNMHLYSYLIFGLMSPGHFLPQLYAFESHPQASGSPPLLVFFCSLLTILTSFLFSEACDRLCFLPVGGSDSTVPYTLNLQLLVQLILGPVTALK